jgi:predicted ATPase
LQVITAALAEAKGSGAHWGDAELHRLRGDLLNRFPSEDPAEVETCYRTALSVAQQQGSCGFELRAAVSLARHLSAHRRQDEARDLLASVYGWFAEGFDTDDLQEAKALLSEFG